MYAQKVGLKIVLLITLLCCFHNVFSQDYDKISFRVDSLASVGLAKSALAATDTLDMLARQHNNAPMQVKAAIYRMRFQSYLEENALVAIINRLNLDITRATYPVKPVLRSILAGMYFRYYLQNRWQFGDRSRLEKPGADYTKWDLKTIIDQTSYQFKLSLRDAAALQKTPIGVLDGVLVGDPSTRYLRPTLYDLLLQRALDFFLLDEPALTKPKQSFTIDDPLFFGDAATFAAMRIDNPDTASTWHQGLAYLQQATLFHLKSNDAEALADLDLKRLKFLKEKSVLDNRDSLYVYALKNIAAAYANKPISADALELLGEYYRSQAKLVSAIGYMEKAATTFSQSIGGKNASIVIKQIKQAGLSVSTEQGNDSGKPLLASIAYTNVKTANVLIYRLPVGKQATLQSFQHLYYNYRYKPDTVFKLLAKLKMVQHQLLNLPGTEDYRPHNAEFKIDALPAGSYAILVKDASGNDTMLMQIGMFKVSHMAYLTRLNPNGKLQVNVMDRETGKPLEGVEVKLNPQVGEASYLESGLTNHDGVFVMKTAYSNRYAQADVVLVDGRDTLDDRRVSFNGSLGSDDGEKLPTRRTIVMTDRQIYRPGQTVYFKVLALMKLNGKSSISPFAEDSLAVNDANNKKITTLKFKTNEFGTYGASFVLPQNILGGKVTLKNDNADFEITVEEYKRPTFKVEFAKIMENYRPNDAIKAKGAVKAYSGYGLSEARVACHVTRTEMAAPFNRYRPNQYRYYNFKPTEIKTDTITTDAQGNFLINFKAVPGPDNQADYLYEMTVEVTDASGETRSAQASVIVGRNDIRIDARNLPDKMLAADTIPLPITINNLNRQPQAAKVKVQVFALKTPGTMFKSRAQNILPDEYILSRQEYKEYFPEYAYRNEDDVETYPATKMVEEFDVETTADKPTAISLKLLGKQPGGLYRVKISATNSRGDTTSLTSYIDLIAQPSAPRIYRNWVLPLRTAVKPGGKAAFLVGADKDSYVLMEKYDGPKLLGSKWIYIKKGQQRIEFPVGDIAASNVQFVMVHQNRVYTDYATVYSIKPSAALKIKMLTMHNLLQPGQKDEWKLQVSGAGNEKVSAEMVADMYDASLDDIEQPRNWQYLQLGLLPNRYPEYFKWNTYGFDQRQFSWPIDAHRQFYSPFFEQHYEQLNMFGYNYFGNQNGGYYGYMAVLRSRLAIEKQFEDNYQKNAALVKNGYEITGYASGAQNKKRLSGVRVNIKGTNIAMVTNSAGFFKIKVPITGILVFSIFGYKPQEIKTEKAANLNIALMIDPNVMPVVDIVSKVSANNGTGLNIDTRDMTFATATIQAKDLEELQATRVEQSLEGRVPGMDIIASSGDPGAGAVVQRDLAGGKIAPGSLNDAESNHTPQGYQAGNTIATRKNFNETAFFYPQLHTNEKGQITIDFTMPESLTKWRFWAFAHTTDLKHGYIAADVLTQKQLSVTANTPRFLREGDTITISARLANLTGDKLSVKVNLQLFNAINMQPVNLLLNPAEAEQSLDVNGATNKAVSFKLAVPAGLDALTYKLTADAGQFTDGEENTIPVLLNRMLITESMPMMVRPGQSRSFNFDKLTNQTSNTLQNKSLTLEYTQNPAWYAVQALPYLMEFPYECSEQVFSRYYANSLASSLVNRLPVIKQVFEKWKAANSAELLSNLEKNQELKATLLEETPWLRAAQNETEQKKRIALLFDLDKMTLELKQNLDKLKDRQLPDGGFPWFGGYRSDRYITQHILAGIGQLKHLGAVNAGDSQLKAIADKAIEFTRQQLITDADELKARHIYDSRWLGATEIHSYYAQSYFATDKSTTEMDALLANHLKLAEQQWVRMDVYQQAMVALNMQRYNKPDVAKAIIKSLLETAHQSDELGMYWAKNQPGWFWYQSPIETQSLMIELFTETGGYTKEVEEMKIWLLRNKQTNDWKTTKATAAACYALLLRGDNWLADTSVADIKLGGMPLTSLKPDVKADLGTGYIKTTWSDGDVTPSLGKADIKNDSKTINWGALHWQYLENSDKITPSNTDITLERKYFVVKHTDAGNVLTTVDATNQPKTGDLLKVVVYLKAGRDYEYLQLKDMRPSGTEPVDALSTYKYQDGLYYYQVTKDVATNFFISNLNKGNYVFEYQLRVSQPGNFSTGITTVQSMYAPEFNAHSEGTRMVVK